ncbi:hypothetical protein ACFWY6_27155 [Streptomyces sp. NPDC059037]|uniref:hypothetical protein n=1 Tax=Streptomyces sp. NPDC059037 TaxID=3346710 RepID=UPI00368FE8E2
MSATTEPVQPGQRWRRKSDRVLTKVLYVDSPFQFRRRVHHRAQRRTITELDSFLKKYELVSNAVPTDTSAQDDDAQVQQEENTTREGILVRPGQIWEDLDSRQKKRRVVVVSVQSGRARIRAHYGTRLSALSVSRMHKHSTGFRLVAPGQLRYGAPTVPSDDEM